MALRGLDVIDAVRVAAVTAPGVTDRRQRINPDDVAVAVPECLRDPGGDGWPPIVDEARLMPVVWQALRELAAAARQLTGDVDDNRQQIVAERRRIDSLEARIAVLEPDEPPPPDEERP